MKQYNIFQHLSGTREAVKQGWSWTAFSFVWMWAIMKKMWGIGVSGLMALLVCSSVMVVWDSTWAIALGNIISLIIFIIFGIYGNSWQEKSLVARGYEQVDTVTAANVEGALALYLKSASTKR